MLLIFEKTVSEPNFAPTYAKFCKILFQEIKAENKSLFNSSLINRIQQEFETNVNDANAKKLKLQPLVEKIDSCADTKERLELQAELEDQEYQFRRRAWGTVRFIGEMFKLQSLTNDRVFICIESLLEHGSEEKLEYMCKLLTTVGHLLESPENTGNARMDKIFRKIQDIIHKSRSSNKSSAANSHYKISSRVRFMMQDVMDLRSRTWDHPRATLTQSHQQQLQQQMMSQQQQQQQQLSNQRRTAIGGAKQDDKMSSGGIYEKNNRLGNYGGGNAGGGGGNQRHYYQKSQKSQQFMQQHEQKLNIDLNKLKFTSDEVTQSTTKLGSSHLYLWRTLGKQSASANLTTNAPATLLSINTNNNTGGGFKRQSSILGSTTQTMPSLANNPFQALDRPDSYTSGSTPPEQQNKQFAIGEESDLPDLSKNKCQKMLNSIIEELLDAGSSRSDSSDSWQQEIVNEWTSLNLRQQKTLLTYILTDYLHLRNVKRAQRKACATIFVHLMRTKVCEPETFTQVFTDLADELPDVLVDVPNMWAYVFEFIGPLLHEQLLHFNDIWLPQWAANINFTTRFLQALIQYFTSEFGATYTRELWNKEFKLEHGQRFMSDKTQWREFINTNGFQYIHDRNYKPTQSAAQSKSVHPAAIAEQVTRIEYLLNAASGCDLPIDYINTNVNINTHFIRSLTKFLCCEYATVTPSSNNAATSNDRFPSSTRLRQLDTELFHHKCIPLLRRCLDGLEIHELACLDAIVDAMQQIYDTPTANQLICSVFDLIYDSEVIPKESFDKWYRAEQQEIINAGSSNDCVGAAGGQLDSKDGAARSSGKKSLTSTVGSAGKASSGEESGVSSAGAVRLNDELHAYMEKLL
ncbi:eukaryotic translation initiation factor 4 gamma 3-like isoform X2 [Eurosta solidaginis]